jgi:hypothetical protein
MKTITLMFITIILLTAGCAKDNLRSDLDESREVWLKFKKSTNNSYFYTVSSSSWVGISQHTTIFISNGVVSGRSYKRYETDGGSPPELTELWTEDSASLNTHERGFTGITLDEIYAKARNEWLKADKNENDIFLEVKNQRMISSCGYVPKNCADDCFRGISILEISPL